MALVLLSAAALAACQPAVPAFSRDAAMQRARESAVQSAPEAGMLEARVDSVTVELITLGEADRRTGVQRGTGGYSPGQSADTPVWWVAAQGYFRFEGMPVPDGPAPIYEAGARIFIYDARTGEELGGSMPDTQPAGTGLGIYLLAEGLPPAEVAQVDLGTLKLEATPFLCCDDIVSYAWPAHEMALTPAAVERIRALKVPTSGTPFVVCVDDEPIYRGAFWTAFSSQSYDGVIIDTLLATERGTARIELGYPGPDFFRGPDPRADPRILRALQAAGKLGSEVGG